MWPTNSTGEWNVEIDQANSWCCDSLVPETYELTWDAIEPHSLPIRVSKLTTSVSGFLFPEAHHWHPPAA